MYQNKEIFNTQEAARYMHITRQGVMAAMKRGLKATKVKGRWQITKADIEEYRIYKHNKEKIKKDGIFIFDMEKGLYSVPQISKILSEALGRPVPVQHIYYAVRVGLLKSHRVGYYYVIKEQDAIIYLEKLCGYTKDQLELIL